MDPRVGRFASIDPHPGMLLRPQTLHDYAYTSNNPVNRVDPTGKFGIAQLGIGAFSLMAAHFAIATPASEKQHFYELDNPVCQLGRPGCTLEKVFVVMRLLPAPLWLVRDLKSRLVETGDIGFAGSFLPGGFVQFRVFPSEHTVENVTLPFHILCCGTITRSARMKDGFIKVRTVGEGKNFSATLALLNRVYGRYVFEGLDNQTRALANGSLPWELQ